MSRTLYFVYMYAPIGIVHMVNGLVLKRVTYNTFSLQHQ